MAKFLNLLKLRSFTTPADAAVEISAATDSASASRLRIDAGGKLTWGDGINAGDTNLYRQIANVLQTDDYFVATGGLTVESYQITTNGASTGNTLVFDGTKFTPGNATGGAAGSTYVTTIGNGASTTFAVTHNLNTRDVFVQVRGATSPYEVIDVQWEATSTSVVTFNFGTPPAADSVRVAIYAAVTGDNVAIPLDGLTDVVITAPEEFQGLSYDGTNWVNTFAPVVTYVRNAEATTLTTGTVVYLFGATGDHATVKRADNDSDSTSSKTIGLVAAPIAASENGPVVTRGYVDGIDLSVGYTAGDVLWLGEDGAFTTTKPTAPEHLVFIGVVVRATNNGIIYVATQNGYELDELHDVSLPSPNAGDVLTYNGSLWVAASAGGSSVTVNDTAPASPEVGDLWYKSDTGQTFVYYDSYWVEIGGAGSLPDGSVTTAKLGTGAVTTAKLADDAVTWDKLDSNVSYRNLLYNGEMQVYQRGSSVSNITDHGYYTADRWKMLNSSLNGGVWQQTISTDAPNSGGFGRSLKVTCTTASSSTPYYSYIYQALEGRDVIGIKKGTVNAQSLTLSFWVKSNVTGTFIVEMLDETNGRSFSGSYTVTSSGTWEYKTITYPPDTTGTFNSNSLGALSLVFWLAAGTAFTSGSLQSSWGTIVNSKRAVGQVNVLSAINNYWQFTGAQLNIGSIAAPYQHKSFGEELCACQRYFEKSWTHDYAVGTSEVPGMYLVMPGGSQASTSSINDGFVTFKVEKRGTPTISVYDFLGTINKVRRTAVGVANYDNQTFSSVSAHPNGFEIRSNNSTNNTNTMSIYFTANSDF